MEFLLKIVAHHWHMSADQYWHLRLLSSLLVGPLVGVLYFVFFDKREQPKPRVATGPKPAMWVDSDGQLRY
ncbi:hypothetical protein GO988_11945 [Hymenobacter sp. HMF4947]|uniref:Uncharacterized protein n=1 Tax=Hymenobacter ginkgonis TaxID=2682976 RepID=A0A7K1TF67_9BACT|nr:hypothetical protein [Hymenobacter ginkgonis]MVN77038.1 hypothetical protein [Hymenobacter ginkgonis]